MANKAYKVRLYPNDEQIVLINKTFGCCRLVYNLMLAVQKQRYANGEPYLGKYDAFKYMTAYIKSQNDFLYEADSKALMNSVFHLDNAFVRFFKHKSKYPKFKSKKKSRKSYTTNNQNNSIKVVPGGVKLPKLGVVKAVLTKEIPEDWVLKSATVFMNSCGHYYVSLLYSYEDAIQPVTVDPDKVIGLDYKSDGLYVDSNGKYADMPHYYRESEKKLGRAQRKLSRKVGSKKGEVKSKNYEKQRKRVNKIHTHIANQRSDFLHKESLAIAKQCDAVGVESLNMRALSNKGFGNGKATMDNGWGMFLNMLEYKLKDRGKRLIRVSRWFPSSQLCSSCGYQNPELKDLKIREWVCPECGTHHDRDENAAINLRQEALRVMCL